MRYLLRMGNSLFLFACILWLFFSLRHPYLNTESFDDYAVPFSGYLLLFLFLYGFAPVRGVFHRLAVFVMRQKKWLMFLVGIFQLYLLLTSAALAFSDTEIIYSFGIGQPYPDQLNYISLNPNNYSLVLWFKLVNALFGSDNLVLFLAFFNILFIDGAIFLLYRSIKKVSSQKQADIGFSLFILIFGLSPQFLYTYSDSITLFLVTLTYFLFLHLLDVKDKMGMWKYGLLTGLSFGTTVNFRVPTLIYLIAATIIFMIYLIQTRDKKWRGFMKAHFYPFIASIIAIVCSLILIKGNSIILNVQESIPYDASKNRSLSYYFDLGLTHSGSEHADLPKEILEGNLPADVSKRKIAKDIEQRLEDYKGDSSWGRHLFYKYDLNVAEGMFGWARENVLAEEGVLKNSLITPILESDLAKETRKFVYVTGEHYSLYPLVMQVVWCVIILGLILYAKHVEPENYLLLGMQLALLGGLLFLMLFEGGRSRYLIQFLPAILIISSMGLTKSTDSGIISIRKGEK